MAELNVQPKKKTSLLPWLLLLLGIVALIWYLATRHKDDKDVAATTTVASTANDTASAATTIPATSSATGWDAVDMNAPAVNYEEITNKNINVRGNNNYGIYGLGENVLFDEGKATIRSDAQANLKEISTSINKRYKGGDIRVFGYTDAKGSAGANKDLAQQRADAVKGWLQSNGFDSSRISENAIGEAQPVASNSTAAGRQQNRRVEIVARGGSATK